MAKYTPQEREALAAAAKRLRLDQHDNKVSDLRYRAKSSLKAAQPKEPQHRRQRPHQETESESLDRRIRQYKLQHLPKAEEIQPYDVTKPTRYPEVVMWNTTGSAMLDKVLKRYAHIMKPQGITPQDFNMWREHFMLMSPEQLGALIRVSPRTVRAWESGQSRIPFSMWWVMHVTLQDPAYFLTRPGFHDFYIEYIDGVAHLCSYSYPDIRWTPTDLYFNRCALNEVLSLRREVKEHIEKFQALETENTRLRRMLKTRGVTAELEAMQAHISDLMKRVHTADVMQFEVASEAECDTPPAHKAA